MKIKLIEKILVLGILIFMSGTGVVSALNGSSITNFQPMNLGNWLYVGGSNPGNYSTIQEAIGNASNGDTVFVYDDMSPYQENIRINKQIFVIGENRDTTIISGVTGQDHVVRINYKNIELKGFTIIGNASGQDGITVYPLMELCTISNNIIKDSDYGIFLQATSSRITISNNIILNNDFQGIFLQESDRNIISGNTIEGNGDFGIVFDLISKQNLIDNNTIDNNFGGIQLSSSSSQNNISGNQVTNNNMEGIAIKGILSTVNEIEGNNITNNNIGLKISSGGKNIITSNNFKNNIRTGLQLSGSNDNIVKMNNFMDNRQNARFVFSSRTIWDENYWDDWIGIRFEAPIFKNFPKTIRGFIFRNYDKNPQEEPYDI